MKLIPVTIAASLAFASTYAAESVNCDLSKLTPLITDPDFTACTTKSSLKIPPPSAPTKEILLTACNVPECMSLIAKVKAKNLGDCTIGTIKLESQLLTPAAEVCANAAGSATTTPTTTFPSTGSPSSTSPASSGSSSNSNSSTTTATLTPTGDVTTSSSASGSEDYSDDSSNSTPSTVPAPSESTGVRTSSMLLATTAALVLSAASLMM